MHLQRPRAFAILGAVNRVSVPVACAVLGIIGSAGLLLFKPRMAPAPGVSPVDVPARGPAKKAEPAPSAGTREAAKKTVVAPSADASKPQRAAPKQPVTTPPVATSRSEGDALKLTKLRAVLDQYSKPGATS